MDDKKSGKVKSIIQEAAAKFFQLESNKTSMITITRVELAERGKRADIFFTVFPEDKEDDVIDFAKRKRSELREFLMKETGLQIVPFVDVKLDVGEKNRQKLDSLKI